MGRRLILRNTQAPGDIIVLSAAIRDLHIAHPGLFDTEIWVSPGAEHIYYNNPNITAIHGKTARRAGAQLVQAGYSAAIKHCNQTAGKHFLWGFIDDLNTKLSTKIKLTEFRPAVYMSDVEKAQLPFEEPYWVFLSGGKKDYPTKIWDQTYWQDVIDKTRDRVNWVQLGGGSSNHIMHTPKNGIYANMVAKTDCRNFLRLIYHAEGVVCVVTAAMHAAAAFNKPCVVIAGGREPWWWEAYNDENRLTNMRLGQSDWQPPADDNFVPHKFLHTMGQLDCCRKHGCWKARLTSKGGSACKDLVTQNGQTLPRCKAMIKPEHVVAAIDKYLNAGLARRASPGMIISIPHTAMATPSELPSVPAPAPAPPPVVFQASTLPKLTYCAFGGAKPPSQLKTIAGELLTFENGTSRVAALQRALAIEGEWLLWLERGTRFSRDSWLLELVNRFTHPAIFGRAHRLEDGTLFPYPAFFAVHHSLVKEGGTFASSFNLKAEHFKPVDGLVLLPTTIIPIAELPVVVASI